MVAEISITNWYVLTVLKEFKSDPDSSHILSNGIIPEDIYILCVNILSFIHTLGKSNTKLVRLFQIARTPLINHQDNVFLLLNNIRYPPIKRRITL